MLLDLVHKVLTWRLFSRRDDVIGRVEIIKWWELRRIPFNVAVGSTGVVTFAILFVVDAIAEKMFGEPLVLPGSGFGAVVGVISYAIAANLCFTAGWLTEIFVRETWREKAGAFAQISFLLGLIFSILLTLAPAALFSAVLVVRLVLQ